LDEARAVDARFHRERFLSKHNPAQLRTLFQHSLKMSNPRGQKVHSATEITNGKLEIHRGVFRPRAHAGSPEGEPKTEQKEMPLDEGREQAKGSNDDRKVQEQAVEGANRPKIQRRIQQQPRGGS